MNTDTLIGEYDKNSETDLNNFKSLRNWVHTMNRDLEDSGSMNRYFIRTEVFENYDPFQVYLCQKS